MKRVSKPIEDLWWPWILIMVGLAAAISIIQVTKGEEEMPIARDLNWSGSSEERGTENIPCDTGVSAWSDAGRVEELKRKAALWEAHGWRAQAQIVESRIMEKASSGNLEVWILQTWTEPNRATVNGIEHLAHAFVRTARELKLPLWLPVALAETESMFDQNAHGKAGERSMMQILPYKDRPMDKIGSDPAFAVEWAMKNCFMPGYNLASDPTKAIRFGLLVYNGGPNGSDSRAAAAYADEVIALGKAYIAESELWAEVPE